MKTILTLEFPSAVDAAAAISRLLGTDAAVQPALPEVVKITAPVPPVAPKEAPSASTATDGTGPAGEQLAAPVAGAKKTRKPRADAGVPRGAYKTTDTAGATTPGAEAPAAGAGVSTTSDEYLAGIEARNAAARASIQTPAAPAAQISTPAVQTSAPAAAGPATTSNPQDGGKKLTLEDARAALGRINQTEGLGMPGCMAHLAKFGTNRISAVPAEKYAEFIASADAAIAAHVAKAA